MLHFNFSIIFIFLLLFLKSFEAIANSNQAILYRNEQNEYQISSLTFPTNSFAVTAEADIKTEGETALFFIQLQGKYISSQAQLFFENQMIPLTKKGTFEFKIYLKNEKNFIELMSIEQDGKYKIEKIQIEFKDYELAKEYWKNVYFPNQINPQTWSFTPSIGFSYISYQQPGIYSLDQLAMSAKLNLSHSFKNTPWSVGINGYGTLFNLTSNNSAPVSTTFTSDPTLRFIGINLRGGYRFTQVDSNFNFYFMGGLYYTTSISNPADSLGYSHLGGFQLFPTVSLKLKKDQFLVFFMKFSPVSTGFNFLSFNSREIAGGSQFFFSPQKNGNTWSISADYANLHVQTSVGKIAVSTYSCNLGYSL